MTSDYGTRVSPMGGASSNHKGIDIGASGGAAIVAAADGTVTTCLLYTSSLLEQSQLVEQNRKEHRLQSSLPVLQGS